jgi:hypothetical protein
VRNELDGDEDEEKEDGGIFGGEIGEFGCWVFGWIGEACASGEWKIRAFLTGAADRGCWSLGFKQGLPPSKKMVVELLVLRKYLLEGVKGWIPMKQGI